MINKKTKKVLKDWGYKIESESPLKLATFIEKDGKEVEDAEVLIGIPAQVKIKEIEEYISEDSDDLDFSALKKMDDDDYLLVTANTNYADEFDMNEWTTMTVADFKDLVEKLKNYDDEIEWGFGTNESMTFNDGEDLLGCLEFQQISPEEYDVLDKLFGGGFDGGAGTFEHIYELGDDEDEDEDDDEEEGFLSKTELRYIEKLKQYDWSIKVHNEEECLLEFKNTNGDFAISDSQLISDLYDYHRRNK